MGPLPLVGQSFDSDAAALNRLTPLLYEQLRCLAKRPGIEEVAQIMAVSAGTVKREWDKARARGCAGTWGEDRENDARAISPG
jgi:hypothetical protein